MVLEYVRGTQMIALLGKCDPKGRSHLTSQPPDPAPASAEAVTCPGREVREGSFGELVPQGPGRDQGTVAQHGVCQGIYREVLLRSNLLACAGSIAVGRQLCDTLYKRTKEHTYLGVAKVARTDNQMLNN